MFFHKVYKDLNTHLFFDSIVCSRCLLCLKMTIETATKDEININN